MGSVEIRESLMIILEDCFILQSTVRTYQGLRVINNRLGINLRDIVEETGFLLSKLEKILSNLLTYSVEVIDREKHICLVISYQANRILKLLNNPDIGKINHTLNYIDNPISQSI